MLLTVGAGLVRAVVFCFVLGVLTVSSAEAQLRGSKDTRLALPTLLGETGFWVVPTAETLREGNWSASLFRSNSDRKQGLTDVSNFGFTIAYGATDRAEVFGSWSVVRLDRDMSPLYVRADPTYGGVTNEFPYVRSGWSKNLGGLTNVGLKLNLLSQSRQNRLSLAPRVVFSFPTGPTYGSTDGLVSRVGFVASGEISEQFELSANIGGVYRADTDGYNLSNGIEWGVGVAFPSRMPLRALIEAFGETSIQQVRLLGTPIIAEDRSVQPLTSHIPSMIGLKIGAVWQASSGLFIHGGVNYTPGVGDRTVGGRFIQHSGVGAEVSVGWHMGTRRYISPSSPSPVPTPLETVSRSPVNRNPTVALMCDPCMLEVGESSMLTAIASDPDGDTLAYRWSAPQGNFSELTSARTVWTSSTQPGVVTVTVITEDGRGGSATSAVDIQIVQRAVIEFDPVYFDFDMFVIRSDSIVTLDGVVNTLQTISDLDITIEGHTDSVGTLEYNLALGERRASAVYAYLVERGIDTTRMQIVSFGEEDPIASNDILERRQLNRRAEIIIMIQ